MKQIKLKGLTNQITLDENLVIKKSNPIVDYYIDRNNEAFFYNIVKSIKPSFIIYPVKWEFDNDNNFILTLNYFLNSKTFDNHLAKFKESDLKQVIKLIDHFHSLNINLKTFDPKSFLNLFTSKVKPIKKLEPFKIEIQEIINTYFDDTKLVVSHNDLVRGNFLKLENKEIKLIDFELVNLNHPLFDYASFISESCSKKEKQVFLNLLNLNDKEKSKLNKLIKYQNYLWAYWSKYMFEQTNKKVYLKIMKIKIKNLLAN